MFLLAVSVACAAKTPVDLESASAPLLPIDVSYRVEDVNFTLEVRPTGAVRLFGTRAETQEAECSSHAFEAITLLLNSQEFQSSLATVEEQDIYLGPNSRKLVALWGRGTPDGIEGERPYHPTVMVALDDIELVPAEVVDLLRLLDRVGAEAFGGSYTKILPASSQ
jgi:hypothetical protein